MSNYVPDNLLFDLARSLLNDCRTNWAEWFRTSKAPWITKSASCGSVEQ
jgi:hypothetical protein